jgi:hypothetical protein
MANPALNQFGPHNSRYDDFSAIVEANMIDLLIAADAFGRQATVPAGALPAVLSGTLLKARAFITYVRFSAP